MPAISLYNADCCTQFLLINGSQRTYTVETKANIDLLFYYHDDEWCCCERSVCLFAYANILKGKPVCRWLVTFATYFTAFSLYVNLFCCDDAAAINQTTRLKPMLMITINDGFSLILIPNKEVRTGPPDHKER